MLFFLCNAIEGQLIASGAFEILLNGNKMNLITLSNESSYNFLTSNHAFIFADVPVWSKLETGRIPQPPELFQIIDSHMQFGKIDTDRDAFST